MGPISCPETSAKELPLLSCLMTQKSAVLNCFAAEAWNHAEDLLVCTLNVHVLPLYRSDVNVHVLPLYRSDVKFIKLGRFRWAVHVRGLEVSDPAEKVLCTKPGGNGERRGGNSEVEVVRWGRGGRRTGWVQKLRNKCTVESGMAEVHWGGQVPPRGVVPMAEGEDGSNAAPGTCWLCWFPGPVLIVKRLRAEPRFWVKDRFSSSAKRLYLWIKRPRRDADHSPPCSAEVRSAWLCASTRPCHWMKQVKNFAFQVYLQFYFVVCMRRVVKE